jgi:hypothetical protein
MRYGKQEGRCADNDVGGIELCALLDYLDFRSAFLRLRAL